MKIIDKDKAILREFAKKYAEIAALPIQKERMDRARDINDLKPRRPIVWIYEIPWHEMDIDDKLTLVCQDPLAREAEWFFRTALYRHEYLDSDMVTEPAFPLRKKYTNSGMGIEIDEHVISSDDKNHIVSHSYNDQLDTMDKVNALKEPVIKALPDLDAQRLEAAQSVFGDILPIRPVGEYIYHAPWDVIPRYRGVMPVLMDLIDKPELMHATVKKITDYSLSVMKQKEAQGLLEHDITDLHCTPPYVSDIEKPQGPAKLKNVWFRGMAQLFTEVSPDMFKEFDLDYMKPLMAECGLVYYGCCEALERKIDLLKTIPNLRKIGVSPQANPESCAEQIRGDYVYAHKPNPAHVAGNFDTDTVREEIMRVINTCQAHGCPYEFVLKDISTVGYKPGNLIQWAKTVQDVISHVY